MKNEVSRTILLVSFFCQLTCFLACGKKAKDGPQVHGLVPNQETAIKIAEAVWLPIYGKGIYDEEPFEAKLTERGDWLVLGAVHGHGGGELMMILQPKDGKIIFCGRDPGK